MRIPLSGRFTALCLLFSSALASAAPFTSADLVAWPRMNVADFACLLEQRSGHADAQFSCAASRKLSNWAMPAMTPTSATPVRSCPKPWHGS